MNPASIEASAARVRAAGAAPELAIVLGSGWDGIAELVREPLDIAYAELPAFPKLGVAGHAGTLRLGAIAGRRVALLRGRKHAYESGDAAAMKGAIRTLAALGCRAVVLTNAAGSLDATMRPGTLMLISDHLNIVQRTPLHDEPSADRFVAMVDAYDPGLRQRAQAAATAAGIGLCEGVYAWVLGPQFETPAEIRMLQKLGAQAVGMSTVPETILARHAGLKVLGLSMLTNMGAGLSDEQLSHAHTLHTAQGVADDAARLLAAIVTAI
ncbi:MAG: purine-nucleoside phosphorylase [Burkholderiales bacterium]|nr:purine-nucleoside phosphorylase [Burkholderiales bacterium]